MADVINLDAAPFLSCGRSVNHLMNNAGQERGVEPCRVLTDVG